MTNTNTSEDLSIELTAHYNAPGGELATEQGVVTS